ncbi:MAG TPA: TIGR03621 family F420-dependent LLM class oxidoreductase [Candidatus Limnocylindrales bacterium]|nr:TIGR03621 family F420-dependent LLM class oxidoreductase [Candidatus Limnocylindrales bacterium]
MQPFRFAVYTNSSDEADRWSDFARRAEGLGYAALYVTDHLGRQLAPTAALAAAAAVTSTLRIGPYVFANDFRHPLIVAREAATLDRLSGGRLDLGLGAGWKRSDYRQLGLPYDPPGVRIDRLIESLGIIRRLLSGEEVTHAGRFYQLERARVQPAPVQRPHPRIMLGGGGPRMLRVAAREAQIVSFVPQFSASGKPMWRHATEAALAERATQVRAAAGARFDELELNVFVGDAGVIGDKQPLSASLRALVKSAGPAVLGGSPYLLYGTLDQLRAAMLRRRDRSGVSSYGIPAHAMESFAPLVASLAGR